VPVEVAHIALDPLDAAFDPVEVVARVRRRASAIKRILLDQTVVSGVGNIYADEALWRAGLHGDRLGVRLAAAQVRSLLDHVREVMEEALGQGGTSFDALYVNVNGESGYFDRALHVYGQEGRPCSRCGTPIARVPFMNRSSFFCPVCQPRPRQVKGGAAGRTRIDPPNDPVRP
jgi:formamidopyrimidine-DNA glycosylase